MKITMLGTGAIGYPLSFCNCENCKQARIHGGKSLRKRSSILINDDLIIDLGPDTQSAMMMYNKDMGKIKYLLETHIHIDHYDEGLLITRIPYMGMINHEKLEIVALDSCMKILSNRIHRYEKADLISEEGQKILNVHSNTIKPGEKIKLGDYEIKAIHTDHDKKHGSILYVVKQNDKTVFYATDTTPLSDKALDQLSEYKLDVVIMDHSFGDVDYCFAHLNARLFKEQIQKMDFLDIIDENTKIFGTHISHESNPYHELLQEKAKQSGYDIAYDGMEIEL